MAVFKPRNRMLTFRLAEAEFQQIKELCMAEGARSISDYARASLCNTLAARGLQTDPGLDARVQRLDGKVEELDRAVKEITQILKEELGARSQK